MEDQRRQQATLMELLCFECWNTEICRLAERVVEAHHRADISTHCGCINRQRHILSLSSCYFVTGDC